MNYRTIALGVAVAFTNTGCGTVNNLTRPIEPSEKRETRDPSEWRVWDPECGDTPGMPVRQVYGGVRGELALLKDLREGGPAGADPTYAFLNIIPFSMTVVDLPLTAVGDTLTLPYTIPADVVRSLMAGYRRRSGVEPGALVGQLPPVPAQEVERWPTPTVR